MKRDKAIKYMKLVLFQSELFSKDPATKVGALFLCPKTHNVLSLGYNGMPRGVDEKDENRWKRPTKYLYVEHAERNAIYNACRKGTCLEGSICIVTMFPCCDCTRGIVQTGVKTLITFPMKEDSRWNDNCTTSKEILIEAGVEIIYLSEEETTL